MLVCTNSVGRTSDKDGKLGWWRDISPSQGLLQSAILKQVFSSSKPTNSVGIKGLTSNRPFA